MKRDLENFITRFGLFRFYAQEFLLPFGKYQISQLSYGRKNRFSIFVLFFSSRFDPRHASAH